MCIRKSSFTTTTQYTLSTFIHIGGGDIEVKWWGYLGQVVGISRSTGGGNYQGQVVGISRSSSGDIKAKWWGYQGQGRGLEVKVKKKW
jgi:hypothetical protein